MVGDDADGEEEFHGTAKKVTAKKKKTKFVTKLPTTRILSILSEENC